MKLNTLKLTNFKNYEALKTEFSTGIHCFLGKNGMGKTNLLDALYYLSMTRSALNAVDQQNIRHGHPYFAINSEFELEEPMKVNCYYEQGKKKIIKVNGQEVKKLSDHIGTIPSVLISPEDTDIIREGSEIRRKLFDSVIAQHDRQYLDDLMQMQRILKQRNSLLKGGDYPKKGVNLNLLAIYDDQLLPLFERIGHARERFLQEFTPFFSRNYQQLFDGEEAPAIRYKTDTLKEDFAAHFREAVEKDLILQRTTKGSHKDDYIFWLNDRPIKKFGSQGQQKSFIIALKLAEYDYLKAIKGFNPLLLLDDIFDKLDDERIDRLVRLLADTKRFTQIFMTDARSERSKAFFKGQKDVHFYEIAEGKLL